MGNWEQNLTGQDIATVQPAADRVKSDKTVEEDNQHTYFSSRF